MPVQPRPVPVASDPQADVATSRRSVRGLTGAR